MTVLSPTANAKVVYRDGSADAIVLIALRSVNAGDTLDLGPSGVNVLMNVYRAVVISLTNSGVQIAAGWSGTNVTMPTGLSNDFGYLLAWGASS